MLLTIEIVSMFRLGKGRGHHQALAPGLEVDQELLKRKRKDLNGNVPKYKVFIAIKCFDCIFY